MSMKDWIPRSKTFLVEVKGEWGKVTKPARREVVTTTGVVVVTSFVFGLFLWLFDQAFTWIYETTFSLLGL